MGYLLCPKPVYGDTMIIVETGDVVENANSYISVEEATQYFELYNKPEWSYRPDLQEAALINATSRIDLSYGNKFRGDLCDSSQRLMFPRSSFYAGNGVKIKANTIPVMLKDAVCEYALLYCQEKDILPNDIDGEVTSTGLGVGSGAYSETTTYAINPKNYMSRKAFLLIGPLLKQSNLVVKG